MKIHIKAVPCNPQVVDALLPCISDTTIISKAITQSSRHSHPTCLEDESFALQTDDYGHLGNDQDPALKPRCVTALDWEEVQFKDKTISEVICLYKSKELQCQKGKETDSQEMKQFIRQWNRLLMRNGILYHKNEFQEVNQSNRNTIQLVLPKAFRKQALQGCHNDLGHLGIEQTIDLLRDQFYWPRMMEDTVRHIKQSERCLQFKAIPDKAPMENVDATYPMESVLMDYLTIEANEGGKGIHILVITDHFTQHEQAIATGSQTTKCTAQNLWEKFIVHYGLPEKILTNQKCNFESDLLKVLCEIPQVKKVRTSGYHLQTNGQCKCFNGTLINMLGTLPENPKSIWREQLPTLVHGYNCTRNNVTGFSPYYLMFGRKPNTLWDKHS